MQHFLYIVDCHLMMALEYHKVVFVTLVVSHKQILAVSRIHIFPILQSYLYSRERGMRVHGVGNIPKV